MSAIMRRLAAALIFVSAFASCTVKEDRTPCPCYVEFTFVERGEVFGIVNLFGWKEGERFRDSFDPVDYPDKYIKAVSKEQLYITVYEGVKNQKIRGNNLIVDYGNQADSVYAYTEFVDATGEKAYVDVDFHRQFATVYLDIRKSPEDMNNYSFRVDGNTCGFNMIDFSPVMGAFRCVPTPTRESSIVTFRLPRQHDNSLTLHLSYDDKSGHPASSTLPLGIYIERLSYDWTQPDLQDIFMSVDIINGKLSIGVDGWEEGDDSNMGRVEM